ncbi:MAG: hypothetical protein ACR2P7_05355 [bacterium]
MNQQDDNHREQIQHTYPMMMDPEFRRMCRQDPRAGLIDLASSGDARFEFNFEGVEEVKVVTNAKDKMYIPILAIKDAHVLSRDDLQQVNAAGMAVSTVGCLGSISSLGTVGTTVSSFGTGSCVGSAGTVD